MCVCLIYLSVGGCPQVGIWWEIRVVKEVDRSSSPSWKRLQRPLVSFYLYPSLNLHVLICMYMTEYTYPSLFSISNHHCGFNAHASFMGDSMVNQMSVALPILSYSAYVLPPLHTPAHFVTRESCCFLCKWHIDSGVTVHPVQCLIGGDGFRFFLECMMLCACVWYTCRSGVVLKLAFGERSVS